MRFQDRLNSLGFASYADYLASPHWLGFRREYKRSGSRMTCLVCDGSPIQLHHQTYVRIGRERFSDVVPLCRSHHEAVHEWLKTSGRAFVEYTHEAVAALGGVCPMPIRTTKKPKKGKRPKQKSKDSAGKVKDLVAKLLAMPLTQKQIRAVDRFAKENNAGQLAGLLKGFDVVTPEQEQKWAARRARRQQRKKNREALLARKRTGNKQTPPLVVAKEAEKWKDPLYAMRMLASGHRPPPR